MLVVYFLIPLDSGYSNMIFNTETFARPFNQSMELDKR